MIGRRVAAMADISSPGDYYGPDSDFTGGSPAVFFLLPNGPGRDGDLPLRHYLHHVVSPPHVFRECPDGSLEIRQSIGAEPEWHGFLDEGHVWRGVGPWENT